jgi:predicted acylesterase/phospholipase RssA
MKTSALLALLATLGLSACAIKYQSIYREYLPSAAATVFPGNDTVTEPIRARLEEIQVTKVGSDRYRELIREIDFGNYFGTLSLDDKRRVNGHWLQFYNKEDSKNEKAQNAGNVCIAVSGGGIRSAAFALGVLEGLETKSSLANIKAISATSGGAYAISALYAAASRSTSVFSSRLTENDEELSRKVGDPSFLPDSLRAPLLVQMAVAAPLAFMSTNFNEGWTSTTLSDDYANAIAAFWHGEKWFYWDDWQKVVVRRGLPIPIIVTASLRKDTPDEDAPLAEQVFEWMPFVRGNPTFGYSDTFRREGFGALGVANVVAGSAAAVDSPSSLRKNRKLNFGWLLAGTESLTAAPLTRDTLDNFLTKLRPGTPALYSLNVKSPLQTEKIFHTDGGYADNLAIYPLVRRGCSSIIAIDAEHDPELKYCALAKVATDLAQNHSVLVTMDTNSQSAVRVNTVLANPSQQNRSCQSYDSQAFFTQDTEKEEKFLARRAPETNFRLQLSLWEASSPSANSAPAITRAVRTSIEYIKLVRPKSLAFLSPKEVSELEQYEKNCSYKGTACQFPHDVTAKQAYSGEQFRAYMLLGKNMGVMAAMSGVTW